MSRTIGVFDSGVGGLTVVRALREALPCERIVYLGDTARVPYGSKSPRTVERYAAGCLRFLLERGVDLVVVACNTASATALPALSRAAGVPVIGAVEPGAAAALEASVGRRIGVLGTMATLRSRAYERAIAARDEAAAVTGLPCPLLVPLAEEGWVEGEVAEAVCARYLSEIFRADPQIDTLVLGCTHYPLLAPVLAKVAARRAGREIGVVDSATAMAREASRILSPPPARAAPRGELRCYVTDASRLDDLAPRFLGEPVADIDLVDL
jgi:glutamate racemase